MITCIQLLVKEVRRNKKVTMKETTSHWDYKPSFKAFNVTLKKKQSSFHYLQVFFLRKRAPYYTESTEWKSNLESKEQTCTVTMWHCYKVFIRLCYADLNLSWLGMLSSGQTQKEVTHKKIQVALEPFHCSLITQCHRCKRYWDHLGLTCKQCKLTLICMLVWAWLWDTWVNASACK